VKDIVIVGAGGHARVVADVIRLRGQYHIHGFVDGLDTGRHGTAFEDSIVIGGEETLPNVIREGVGHAIVAIGDNAARVRVARQLVQLGFELPVLIHPSAVIAASVTIGSGTVVFAGAIINSAASIGGNSIINTGATIDHDCLIGDGVHIAPGVNVAGNVTIGAGSLIGVGAAVKPGITIGRGVTVGVGAAVISDVADGKTVVGVPARVIK
jgi:UDP-N-acetylbacillosamine N-acetyltransferase